MREATRVLALAISIQRANLCDHIKNKARNTAWPLSPKANPLCLPVTHIAKHKINPNKKDKKKEKIMGVPTAGSPPVASQWPSFGSSFRQGRAGTYMPEGCHWRLPSFLLFPTCFQTWGTLSNGQGTGAHDVLYGVKQCAPPRTPRRRHRRRLVPWAAGQPPQKV